MESLSDKQHFLKSEIINEGYSGDEFFAFISGLRGEEEVDLNSWTMEELQRVVADFKGRKEGEVREGEEGNLSGENEGENGDLSGEGVGEKERNESEREVINESMHRMSTNPLPPSIQSEQEFSHNTESSEGVQNIHNYKPSQSVDLSNNKNTKEKVPFFKSMDSTSMQSIQRKQTLETNLNLTFQEQSLKGYITCLKLEENEITDRDDLKITVTSPEIIKGSLFSSYCQYAVHTFPLSFSTKRKLSDFEFIHEILPYYNNTTFNPTLPPAHYGLKDDSHKKVLYLNFFINSIIKNRYYRSLPLIFDFVSLSQEEWNNKRKSVYKNVKPIKEVKKMVNLAGKFNIEINNKNTNLALKIKDEIRYRSDAYDKLNTTFDEIILEFQKLGDLFNHLSEVCNELKSTYKESKVFSDVYSRLGKITNTWGKNYIEQKEFFIDNLKYFFKYIDKENNDFLNNYNVFKLSYDSYKTKFEKLKKSQVQTDKEKQELKVLAVNYGFNLSCLLKEYTELLKRHEMRVSEEFLTYNENYKTLFQDYENSRKLLDFGEELKGKKDENVICVGRLKETSTEMKEGSGDYNIESVEDDEKVSGNFSGNNDKI